MYKTLFTVLLVAPLTLAIESSPRVLQNALVARQPISLNPRNIPNLPNTLVVRQTCSSEGEATCEQSCMPIGAVCCNDGSSTYCPTGEFCVPNGCCPDGEVCDGSGGGTMTYYNLPPTSTLVSTPTTSAISGGSGSGSGSGSCSASGEAICEQSCMPVGAVCCNDGSSTYCPHGEYCVTNGCCPNGEVCDGSGGGTLTLGGSSPTTSSKGSNLFPTTTTTPFLGVGSGSSSSKASTTKAPPATTSGSGAGSGSSFGSSSGSGSGSGSSSSSSSKSSSSSSSTSTSSSSSTAQQSKNAVPQSRELDTKAIVLGLIVGAGYILA